MLILNAPIYNFQALDLPELIQVVGNEDHTERKGICTDQLHQNHLLNLLLN